MHSIVLRRLRDFVTALSAVAFATSSVVPQSASTGRTTTAWLVHSVNLSEYFSEVGSLVGHLGASDDVAFVGEFRNASLLRWAVETGAIAAVGRTGTGPGEFRSVASIVQRNDLLFVYDPLLRRLSTFDARSKYHGSVPLLNWAFVALAPSAGSDITAIPLRAASSTAKLPLVRVRSDGVDTLLLLSSPGASLLSVSLRSGARLQLPNPAGALTVWSVSSDGNVLCTATSGEGTTGGSVSTRTTCRSLQGDPASWSIARQLKSEVVSDRWSDSVFQGLADDPRLGREAISALRRALGSRKSVNPIQRLFAVDRDLLWTELRASTGGVIFERIQRGGLVDSLATPFGTRLLGATRDRILVARQTAEGGVVAEIWRMRP